MKLDGPKSRAERDVKGKAVHVLHKLSTTP
jgi:hypothetical protein